MLWVKRQLPWDKEPGEPCEREWTEKDELNALDWMQTAGAVRLIGDKAVLQAVSLVANENPFHPVRDYFDRLVWDKTKRLDKWLTYYLGAADTPYHQAVGACWVISAVARIYQPGCKADCCLILEGEQGIKKSSALRALAGAEWFADEIADLGSKDAALQLRGKLIIELAELDALSRAEVGKIKAYMSRQVDRFRPPYAKLTIDAPRQGIFGGSVNENEYLKDATGGRRFWPVLCGESIDVDALTNDRDQIWAEAVHRYRHLKARWYLDDPEIIKLAKEQQDARYEEDAWQPLIVDWLRGRHDVTVADVLAGPLDIREKSKWTKADQMRVGRIMKRLGWKRKQVWVGGKPEWRYVRQD
jgi:putative DNA primase/helicase